ncbi:MAG: FAD:protein FMN transferase [Gammaproteobacteria bacterium]
MGSTYSVEVADCTQADCSQLEAALSERLEELEQLLSHYRTDSELSAFNQYSGSDWFDVSTDLATVVEYSLEVSRSSNGAFDITVAPAVDAWGFGPAEVTEPPDDAAIARTRSLIDYQQLSARLSPPALRKTNPKVTINLSALAKGYAVDQLALLLESRSIGNYLLEIGGEVRVAGLRPDGKPWRIGIEPPDGGLDIEFIVTPGSESVATSGDYRNFYIENGERISHTISPAEAEPVKNTLASVSVITPSAMQADALATMLMVLGSDRAQAWASENKTPVLMILREENSFRSVSNDEFDAYLINK